MRRRTQAEDEHDGRFVVSLPAIVEKAAFRLPSLSNRLQFVLCPLPVDSAIQRIAQATDLCFVPAAVEVTTRCKNSRDQQRCVDYRQLALPHAPPALHIQKVIVKALVPSRIGTIVLRTIQKE